MGNTADPPLVVKRTASTCRPRLPCRTAAPAAAAVVMVIIRSMGGRCAEVAAGSTSLAVGDGLITAFLHYCITALHGTALVQSAWD